MFEWGFAGRRRTIAWGFVDQGLSSATNFGLSVLAGRLLGAGGLGTVYLAFSVYLIVLMVQRSLVTETLLAITSALDPQRRARTARLGLTMSILGGVTATVLVIALGAVASGTSSTAFFLIAPWLVGSLVQDFWRSLLFRERRGASAAANDALWFIAMAAAIPLAVAVRSESAVMAVWGLGACAGAAFGFRQTRIVPASILEAWTWWRTEAWPFGRWNAATSVVANVGSNVEAFVIAGILGASALGGFRAVQSIFAPLSLIAPAVGLPGLPAVARAYAEGFRRARALAIRISCVAVAASVAFFAVLFLGGWRLLPLLFGASFSQYQDLIVPVAVGQIFAAAGVGFPLLIKVQQRGRFLLISRLCVTIVGLAIVAFGATMYGLSGAVWAVAAWAFLTTLTLGLGAVRDPDRRPRRPKGSNKAATVTAD